MKDLIQRFRTSRDANAAVEFALISPIALLLLAGVVETGRLIEVYDATNRLANQYAIAWADCSDQPAGTCSTELNSYTSAYSIANFVPELTAANVTLSMFEVTMSGSTPNVVYSYPSTATMSPAQIAAAQAAFSSGQIGVVVTASYSHSLIFFSKEMSPLLGASLTPTYTTAQLKS
jgi:Flp pilus assembly protein TadG